MASRKNNKNVAEMSDSIDSDAEDEQLILNNNDPFDAPTAPGSTQQTSKANAG